MPKRAIKQGALLTIIPVDNNTSHQECVMLWGW